MDRFHCFHIVADLGYDRAEVAPEARVAVPPNVESRDSVLTSEEVLPLATT
jgi:hypothetical protein